jgi:hypothetical protein
MHWKAHERRIDIKLIDATLVDPNPGLSSSANLETLPPRLETGPLVFAWVMPTVRDESVNLSELTKRRALKEKRIRLIVCHLLFVDLVESDVPQHLIRLPLDLLHTMVTDGRSYSSSQATRLSLTAEVSLRPNTEIRPPVNDAEHEQNCTEGNDDNDHMRFVD